MSDPSTSLPCVTSRRAGRAGWLVRAYQPGDEEGICALFALVFGRPLSEAQWRWKLRTLPSPIENEWVAVADGRIVGHYAVTPIRFKFGAREVVVPHGCDAMTHPDFRRQGILTALGERANDVWRSASPFQIGFHYGGWGSVRERVGWRPIARLVRMRRVLRPVALLARRMGVRIAVPDLTGFDPAPLRFGGVSRNLSGLRRRDDIGVTPVTRAGEEFDLLWQKISGDYPHLAVRDRAWVQWRYLDKPDAQQGVLLATQGDEPSGYLAYRVQRDAHSTRATILDGFAAPDNRATFRALMQRLRRELTAQGAESVAALAVNGSPLFHALRRHGFWPSRQGFDFSVIPYAQQNFDDAQAWFVTGAEGDVV